MISIRLTFDDGPGPSTARLLDVLREARVGATFFVLGVHAQSRRALLRRMVEERHVIGNHTWCPARDGELSDAQLEEGIAATDRVIRAVFDETASKRRLPSPCDCLTARVREIRGCGSWNDLRAPMSAGPRFSRIGFVRCRTLMSSPIGFVRMSRNGSGSAMMRFFACTTPRRERKIVRPPSMRSPNGSARIHSGN